MTFLITTIAWAIAILVPTIGDAMTILGATTNSGIGFLLPIVFYLKIEKNANRILPYTVFGTICCCSVITLYSYAQKKMEG